MRKRGKIRCEAAITILGVHYSTNFFAGMMMYELHLPLVMLANRQLQKGPNTPGINRGEIKDNLKVMTLGCHLFCPKSKVNNANILEGPHQPAIGAGNFEG